jgi:heme/copper-type cytochrome/quinol oxidase subunit 2
MTRRLHLICSVLLVVFGCSTAVDRPTDLAGASGVVAGGASPEVAQPAVAGPCTIELLGDDYRWRVCYPNGQPNPPDPQAAPIVREMHAPMASSVVLVLKSLDYVYIVELPELGLKEIAVPGLEFRLEVPAETAGRFDLVGDDLCGDQHPQMQGQLVIEPRDHFVRWLATLPSATEIPAKK